MKRQKFSREYKLEAVKQVRVRMYRRPRWRGIWALARTW